MENVKVDDRVRVPTEGEGSFTGRVTYVNEHKCYILPDEEAVCVFLGGDGSYELGRAHWGRLEPAP